MKDKVCIITGASGGIGSAIAEALFDAGFRLVLMGRDEKKLQKVANGRDCLILPGSLNSDGYINFAIALRVSSHISE